MSASQADVAQILAAMSEIKAKFDYAMTEVNKATAAQAMIAAGAAPWGGWVNERLAAQQTVSDDAARDMLRLVNDAKLALDDLRSRVTETEKKPPAHKPKWEMSRPKDMEPATFGGKDEVWAMFKEDLMDFVDAVHPGLKLQFEWTLRQKEEITQPVMSDHPISSTLEDWEMRHELYKLLKRKSEATS